MDWKTYASMHKSLRASNIEHAQHMINRRLPDSPSSHVVAINGLDQQVGIIGRSQLDEKWITSMPGETLPHGGLVNYSDAVWLIIELDVEKEVYQRGIMQRCNHKLRWINKAGQLVEKWCIVEDGTKYLIGEKVVSLMTVGDSRIAVTVGKDADTIELGRGARFLIDDPDVENPSVYQITKANRFFNTSNDEGVFRFILNEVALTPQDHVEQRIANYTDWEPEAELDSDHIDSDKTIIEIVEAAMDEAKNNQDNGGSNENGGWL